MTKKTALRLVLVVLLLSFSLFAAYKAQAFVIDKQILAEAALSKAVTSVGTKTVLSQLVAKLGGAFLLLIIPSEFESEHDMMPLNIRAPLSAAVSVPAPPDAPQEDQEGKSGNFICLQARVSSGSGLSGKYVVTNNYTSGNNCPEFMRRYGRTYYTSADISEVCPTILYNGVPFLSYAGGVTCSGTNETGSNALDVTVTVGYSSTCAPGYKRPADANNPYCVLENAYAAKKDGNCDFKREDYKYVSLDDVDCYSTDGNTAGTLQADGSLLVTGKDSAGRAYYYQVYPNSLSGTSVRQVQQTQIDQTPYVQERLVTTYADGTVVAVESSATPGLVDTTDKALTNPNTAKETQTGSGWPSDYARQGEAATAAKQITDTLLKTADAPADPDLGNYEYKDRPLKDALKTMVAFQWPSTAGTCAPLAFDFTLFGYRFTPSSNYQCEWFSEHGYILRAAMMAGFAALSLFILLRA